MDVSSTPTLTGSEKQVAWATDIRDETLAELADAPLAQDIRDETTRILRRVTSAGWWIDHRDVPGEEWPDMLGTGEPALPPREGLRPKPGGPAARRLAGLMDRARAIRNALDAAGVDRLHYTLNSSRGTYEDLVLSMLPPQHTRVPREITQWRREQGGVILDALDADGWKTPRRERALTDLGWGRSISIRRDCIVEGCTNRAEFTASLGPVCWPHYETDDS